MLPMMVDYIENLPLGGLSTGELLGWGMGLMETDPVWLFLVVVLMGR